jgi:mono/diheme cytochrome c family protein
MARIRRWLVRILGGLAALMALLVIGIYIGSEIVLRRTFQAPSVPITVPADSGSIRYGERLARVRGCLGGCHGERLQGKVFFDEPGVARLVAPSLTAAVARYSNPELARIIRHGVRPNGRGVFGMPAATFTAMSDEDLGAILAFLRQAPADSGLAPSLRVGPLGRLGLVLGQYRSEATAIQHDSAAPPAQTPREPPIQYGRYLARSVCAECHGTDLRGSVPDKVPDLRIVRGYSAEAFTTLLRTGVPLDGRNLRLMGETARKRFQHLTAAEVEALYAYLHSPT